MSRQADEPIRNLDVINKATNRLRDKRERDYLLLVFALNTGISINELSKKNVKYFENCCKERCVHINGTSIAIDNKLVYSIENYIYGRKQSDNMFPSRKGDGYITRQHVNRIVKDAFEGYEAGTPSVDTLKKTFSYWYLIRNKNLKALTQALGFKDEDMTLKFVGLEENKEAYTQNSEIPLNLGV